MRRLPLAGIIAVLLVSGLSSVALAADPPQLTQAVFDTTGRLDAGKAEIEAAAADLQSSTGLQFHAIFINSLDGEDPAAFANRVGDVNGLTDKASVFVLVSLNDRKDAVWSSASTSVDQGELDQIRTNVVEPRLKAGSFVGAITDAIAAIKIAQTGTFPPPAPPVSRPVVTFPSIDWGPILRVVGVGILILILIVVAIALVAWVARRRRELAIEKEAMAKMADLAKQAHAVLLKTDERIRSAEQDVQFVEAQYGADEVKSYRLALDAAKADLQEAFHVGQLIDDEEPETYDERKAMFSQIVAVTDRANGRLEAEEAKIDTLKALERDAVATVTKLTKEKAKRDRAIKAAQTTLDRLNLHGQSAYSAVSKNVEAAVAFHEVADAQLKEAQQLIDASNTPLAAIHVRTAQGALAKAQTALQGVTKMGEALAEAERDLDAQIKSAAADIAQAKAVVKSSGMKDLKAHLDAAENRLARAASAAVKPDADLLAAFKTAVEAQGMADEVLQDVRDEQERKRRAEEQARTQVRLAQTSIDQANSYIESHRSTVGRRARNRLSEAERQYEAARTNSDIFNAATIALIAQQYADEAYRSARSDVQSYESSASASSYGSSYGGSSGSSSSSGSYSSSSSSGSFDNDRDSGGGFSIGSFGGGGSSGGGGGGGSSGGGW